MEKRNSFVRLFIGKFVVSSGKRIMTTYCTYQLYVRSNRETNKQRIKPTADDIIMGFFTPPPFFCADCLLS